MTELILTSTAAVLLLARTEKMKFGHDVEK